ncbi:MAG: GGDEF domain-containing protein, partial [Lachnospiraceae bacterium]|nr:GGDEF domain-containing protein [Lachnospiraceae bacterium]
ACKSISVRYAHSPVYRIGGDEFAVILTGSDYYDRELLFASLNREEEKNIGTEHPVFAAGMAVFKKGYDDEFEAVFSRADKLMYERKSNLKAGNYR